MSLQERMQVVRSLQSSFYKSSPLQFQPKRSALNLPSGGIWTHLPLWRVPWQEVPGRTNVLLVHEPVYTNMFETILRSSDNDVHYVGHLYLPPAAHPQERRQRAKAPLCTWQEQQQQQQSSNNQDDDDKSAVLGTLLRITDYRRMSDGRLLLLVQAVERFVVVHVHQTLPYSVADVQLLPDLEELSAAAAVVSSPLQTTTTTTAVYHNHDDEDEEDDDEDEEDDDEEDDCYWQTTSELTEMAPVMSSSSSSSSLSALSLLLPNNKNKDWWTTTTCSAETARGARTVALQESWERWHRYEFENTQLPLPLQKRNDDDEYGSLEMDQVLGSSLAQVLPYAPYASDTDVSALMCERLPDIELVEDSEEEEAEESSLEFRLVQAGILQSPTSIDSKQLTVDELEIQVWLALNDFLKAKRKAVSPILFGLLPPAVHWPKHFALANIAHAIATQTVLDHRCVRVSADYPAVRRQKRLSYAAAALLEHVDTVDELRAQLLAIPSTRERLAFCLHKLRAEMAAEK